MQPPWSRDGPGLFREEPVHRDAERLRDASYSFGAWHELSGFSAGDRRRGGPAAPGQLTLGEVGLGAKLGQHVFAKLHGRTVAPCDIASQATLRNRKAWGYDAPVETFAERLLRLREAAQLTQFQLAERSGLRDYAISRIESGREPKGAEVARLAVALDVSSDYLLGLSGEGGADPPGLPHAAPAGKDADPAADSADVLQALEQQREERRVRQRRGRERRR